MHKENLSSANLSAIPGAGAAAAWTGQRELDQLRQELQKEQKLRAQAEAQLAEPRRLVRKLSGELELERQGERSGSLDDIRRPAEQRKQNAEFEELQKRCDELEELRSQAENQAQDYLQAMEALREQLARREQEIADKSQEAASASGALQALQADLEGLRAENLALQGKVAAQEASSRTAVEAERAAETEAARAAEAEAEQAALRAEVGALRAKLERASLYLEDRLAEDRLAQPVAELVQKLEQRFARSTEGIEQQLEKLGQRVRQHQLYVEDMRGRRKEAKARQSEDQAWAASAEAGAAQETDLRTKMLVAQASVVQLGRAGLDSDAEDRGSERADLQMVLLHALDVLRAEKFVLQEALATSTDRHQREIELLKAVMGDEMANVRSEMMVVAGERETLRQQVKQSSEQGGMRSRRGSADSSRTDDESPELLLAQNREQALTIENFKQDCNLLRTENKSLRESLTVLEENVYKQSTQLGHTNHRQKIRLLNQMQKENEDLRAKLRKAWQRESQMQSNKKGEDLVASLCSFVADTREASRQRPSACTPRRPRGSGKAAEDSVELSRVRSHSVHSNASTCLSMAERCRVEVDRRCKQQERTIERMSLEFRHFIALIQKAVADAGHDEADDATALLQQLRSVAKLKAGS